MSDFLTEMAEASLTRARAARRSPGADALRDRLPTLEPPSRLVLSTAGFDVMAEVKLASPSQGALVAGDPGEAEVGSLARRYASAGAVAVSVLTEPSRFGGSLGHLHAACREVTVPVMRKDFVVDPIQVLEARAVGASGVLLIPRILSDHLIEELTNLVLDLGMFVLVEVFDLPDLERAALVFDRDVLVGVNCRDLTTLRVDLGRFGTLAPHLPNHLPVVAESGIAAPADAAAVAALGYRLALVGSALVAQPDPVSALTRLIDAGRGIAAGARG